MTPKSKTETPSDVDETNDEAPEQVDPEPELPKVAFELAGEVTAFRHTVGGNEISLDEGDQYLTNDAREIARLDAHDAVRRCEEPA